MQLPDVLHEIDGEIRVKGSRISLYNIISAHNDRWISPEGMVFYFPTLCYDDILAVFAFYDANRAEVDAYCAAYRAELDRLEASTPRRGPTMDELRRRLAAKRKSEAG